MKISDGFKFGIGFFIGYEIAKNINEILGEAYTIVKKRVKEGM